jgi:hypothetical protein
LEPVIAWTAELRRHVHPRRGGAPPPLPDDPSAAFARMLEAYGRSAAVWNRSPALADPELGPRLRAALDRMDRAVAGKTPPVTTPEVEGTLLAILSSGPSRLEGGEVLSYWVATAGLSFAIEALAASRGLWIDTPGGVPRMIFVQADPFPMGLRHWLDLRRRLAAAGEAEWAAARDTAARLRANAPLELRAPLAYLFPDVTAWVEEDTYEALATRKTKKLAGCLACSLTDSALLNALAAAADPLEALAPRVEPYTADLRGLIFTLVDACGRAAVPLLARLRDRLRDKSVQRDCLTALGLLPVPETAAAFAARLGQREIAAALQDLAARHPREALTGIAVHLREQPEGLNQERALALLASLARREPELAATLLPDLPEKARHLLQAALVTEELPRDAEPSELPAVLASPPWTRKRKAPPSLDLPPLPWEDRLIWEKGQRERWLEREIWSGRFDSENLPSDPRARDRVVLLSFGTPHPEPLLEAQGDELRRRVATWAAGYKKIRDLQILYLSDELALALWEAVPAALRDTSKEIIERTVARFEVRALPGLLTLARTYPVDCAEVLQPVRSPAFALLAADALVRLKTVRPAARRWLLAHDECAAVGLIPVAVGPAGKTRETAGAALHFLAENGREELLFAVAERWGDGGDAAQAALRAALAADPLDQAPARPPRLPPFWQPGTFTRPLLRGRSAALPLTAVETLGQILAFSRLDEPYAGIAQVREACDPASLTAFAWDLFTAWQTAGAPVKEQWAFNALAHLGDDAIARRLAPLIRDWPSAGASGRAVMGLDVLRALGTDVSLMYLHGFSQKTKSKALQDKAREKIAEVAEQRGLTPDELADRLVPDLGVGADGSLLLDYGPRAFRVGFDEHLKPFVRDTGGKLLPDLPKPGAADDPELAQQAQETWKTLKKDVKTLAGQQILRLELAMCSRRRWEPGVFRMFFAEHPLLQHLVRRLVWGAWDGEQRLRATFRVVEDGSCAGPSDDTWELPEDVHVGLIHRLDLTSELAARWGEIFADYEILQPFPQLGREVWTVEEEERESRELHRLAGATVKTGRLLALVTRHGWRRATDMDGGVITCLSKPLPNGAGEALLEIEPGIYAGAVMEEPEQTLEPLILQGELPFGALDPVTFSELIRDLESLR